MSVDTIGDHVGLQRGTTYKSALLGQPGPLLLGLGSIARDGGFRPEKLKTYGGPSPDKLLVYPGDLYVSLKDVTQSGDLLGSIARVPEGITVGRMTQDTVKLCFKSDISKSYFYWLLRTPQYRQHCRSHATGTTNLGLSRDDFFAFKVPDFNSDREKIIALLEDLESKINLNKKTNQTLEHIAQAIFKSWFVDFDPTRAKITANQTGQNPERAAMAAISGKTLAELDQLSTEQLEPLRTTAGLFPDALVDSELGEVPEGWVVGCVGDVAVAKGGYAFKGKSFVEEGNPVVKIKNITGDGRVDLSGAVCIDDDQAQTAERFRLSDGNLLMAMTGATVGKIGFVVTQGQSIYLNQRVARFESDKFGEKIAWFLFCCFGRESTFKSVVDAAQGSAQPNISSSGIESTELVLPSDELIALFCDKTDSLFQKWLSTVGENADLEIVRDTLLPKLLSGELTTSKEATCP